METALQEKDFENPTLKLPVDADNKLKELFVEYVGDKLKPKDGNVTVEMIVEVLAEEFPEFLMVVAEENFIRGYSQAMADIKDPKEFVKTKKVVTKQKN